MKKLLNIMLVLVMLLVIPNIVKAEEVSIENITLIEHSDYVLEKTPASASGLNINFDLSFTNLDDYAKYEVIINNPTKTEYEIEQETDFKSSDHVVYTYSYEGDEKVLKANSKIKMYITLTYKTPVQPEELKEGKYVETNKLTVNLSNGTENPKTADASTMVLAMLTVMLIGSLLLYKYTKNKELLGTLAVIAVLIPLGVYAAEKLKINVETQITVEEKHRVSYYAFELIKKSEEANYNIFQLHSVLMNDDGLELMGMIQNPSVDPAYVNDCTPTQNEEYELCRVEIAYEIHSAGEKVELPSEITMHAFDENGTLVENTLKFNFNESQSVWFPDIGINPVNWREVNESSSWWYDWDLNDNQSIEFSEDTMDSNLIGEQYPSHIELKTPASFTMPNHDVIFYTFNACLR